MDGAPRFGRASPVTARAFEPPAKVLRMPTFDDVDFAGFGEIFQRVGSRGLEQPVTRFGPACIGKDHRACNELGEQIGDCLFVDRGVGHDRRGGFERKAAGENGQTPQDHAFLLRKQIMTPVERRAERLLPRQRGAPPARQ